AGGGPRPLPLPSPLVAGACRESRAASSPRARYTDPRSRDARRHHRRGHGRGPQGGRRARRIALLVSGSGPAVGRWGILALIMAAQTFANVGPLGVPSIAPLIRDDLSLSVAEAGSFISAYYIGPSLMSLPAGWMAGRWGVLPSMVVGQVLIAVGLVAVGGSHAFPLMAVCMVVAGAGYRLLHPTPTQ